MFFRVMAATGMTQSEVIRTRKMVYHILEVLGIAYAEQRPVKLTKFISAGISSEPLHGGFYRLIATSGFLVKLNKYKELPNE